YKARLNNLIGTADIEPQIISPQWSNARLNFPTKKIVGGAKFGLVSRLVVTSTVTETQETPPHTYRQDIKTQAPYLPWERRSVTFCPMSSRYWATLHRQHNQISFSF